MCLAGVRWFADPLVSQGLASTAVEPCSVYRRAVDYRRSRCCVLLLPLDGCVDYHCADYVRVEAPAVVVQNVKGQQPPHEKQSKGHPYLVLS